MVQPVPETIDFPKEEEKIIDLWNKLDVFKTCLKQSKGKPRYSFYDGPPFATGLPHYGHILAGTIKDIVTRYAHQRGFHVERRFGWDCHGLPVEFEIDKNLGIKGPEDVAKMGIDKYNSECRKIVMRYAAEWERIVGRLGRWIDFQNDYKTLYPWFMESIWWVFKELFIKGLVYKGVKVMPYSTACNTPLSNFESGQNYKEVVDPAVIVSFPIDDEPDVLLLAWTTTPWTLPSNISLCVNPNLNYVKVKDVASGDIYILMEARLEALYKKDDQYTVLETFKGEKLKGKRYKPLFPYFTHLKEKGAFQVLNDGYVTEESGTGVVHQAPYFGEDDYRVCLAAKIITRDQEIICPVDASGRFTQPVTHFLGQHVKDADKNIIKWLKDAGRLINNSTVKHSYPFCWRSETPLIYKAVPSWFVRVEQMSKDLLKSSQSTYWVPDFVKEKRFGNWLRDARDWAISRNRYWGTPIPLWMSDDAEEIVCVGSIAELQELTGTKVTDLHRESIDDLTIPSKRPGQPPLKRVPEVFDCWFESGSMPYAQMHYPFERTKEFEDCFPADFIAEGIDQTRGWFYTLLVISTALFNKPPFKNLIANGLVLAADGQKMSKRKKNYPDPMEVVNKFGADALRLYLINSPVVRAENLRFKEEGVRDVLKDVFLPWYNAYRFLVQNIDRLAREDGKQFVFVENASPEKLSQNIMDRWILSFTQSLLQFVKREMAAYRLYTVIPRLVKFIDNLTNWYVRMNRKRLKGEGGAVDCHDALHTLYQVLYSMIRIMAPFTPFLTEIMYQNLRHFLSAESVMDSIHYIMLPEPTSALINEDIEKSVALMQTVIDLGRVIRDRKTIPVKYPLPEVVVIHQDEKSLQQITTLERYIQEELNIRRVTVTTDKKTYGVMLRAEPDHKTLGARLKGAFKPVMQAIKELTDEQIQKFLSSGKMELLGHEIEQSDIRVMFTFSSDSSTYEAHAENDLIVLLNTTADEAMQDEGIAREVINRVQKLRKKAHLVPSDPVKVYYKVEPEDSQLQRIAVSHNQFIENTLKVPLIPLKDMPPHARSALVIEEMQQLKGSLLNLVVIRDTDVSLEEPFCRYVNVELCGLKPRYGAEKPTGVVLLENPARENVLSTEQLKREIEILFGIYGVDFEVRIAEDDRVLSNVQNVGMLDRKLLYVCRAGNSERQSLGGCGGPLCRFVNVEYNGRKATVLLDNASRDAEVEQKKLVARVFDLEANKLLLTPSNGHLSVTLSVFQLLK
ncbi:hypothetical protein L9F63_008577, partial [Diploptera punctata]